MAHLSDESIMKVQSIISKFGEFRMNVQHLRPSSIPSDMKGGLDCVLHICYQSLSFGNMRDPLHYTPLRTGVFRDPLHIAVDNIRPPRYLHDDVYGAIRSVTDWEWYRIIWTDAEVKDMIEWLDFMNRYCRELLVKINHLPPELKPYRNLYQKWADQFHRICAEIKKHRAWRYVAIRTSTIDFLKMARITMNIINIWNGHETSRETYTKDMDYIRNCRRFMNMEGFFGKHVPRQIELWRFRESTHEKAELAIEQVDQAAANLLIDIQTMRYTSRYFLRDILIEYMPKELCNIVKSYTVDPTLHPTYFKNVAYFGNGTGKHMSRRMIKKCVRS